MTLYQIQDRFLETLEMAESGEYEETTINDTLETIEWELEEKADNYAKAITIKTGEMETIKKEIERLTAMKKAKENVIERLKHNLQNVMENTDKKKFKTDLHSFRIQANPPSVDITDSEMIPESYLIMQEPVISKKDILRDLKAGVEVPGARLMRSESLRIS